MDERSLRRLLSQVRTGHASVADAISRLKDLPFVEMGYATLDTHRALRTGVPEVVLAEPKTTERLLRIVESLASRGQPVLVTRVKEAQAVALKGRFPKGVLHAEARIFHLAQGSRPRAGKVSVVCAGTADIPVAEEAAVTAEALGARVTRIYDVGVAGLHRLLSRRQDIMGADAVVVVAGMEGALASVVGGLTGAPVVAVPTSVGYGANFGGVSALLTMLNSCAPNVATVNIDNGFGGGFYAALSTRRGLSSGRATRSVIGRGRAKR
ncbi:MAG: nickel pincer cofactor biosynthesis protein LarB [Myxococcaceae bacterium]